MAIYKTTETIKQGDESTTDVRLVDAPNRAAAINYIARDSITAEPVSVAEAMKLATDGVKVEQAKAA